MYDNVFVKLFYFERNVDIYEFEDWFLGNICGNMVYKIICLKGFGGIWGLCGSFELYGVFESIIIIVCKYFIFWWRGEMIKEFEGVVVWSCWSFRLCGWLKCLYFVDYYFLVCIFCVVWIMLFIKFFWFWWIVLSLSCFDWLINFC